ncbi:hypothetical protein ACVTD8_16260 [Vibrio cholerae]|nr:hypothetical protein [Vibrio cholerae]EKF9373232.1 hypothetical protein [Vibrio cholerae]MCU8168325.1 hypothetical protein [Vibrio vulnificus]MCU8172873.1 hypothetical protein [Vibrio vulnificus]MCU8501712.1 hypothetical protein [Vibrio vulnificus]
MYIVLTYGFPFILIAFEWGLKFLLKIQDTAFAGPALAAAALSFLMPLTKPKVIEIDVPGHPGTFVTSSRDSQLIGATWLLVFLFLFLWGAACYLSLQKPSLKFWELDVHLIIGLATYFLSLIMTLTKEKL